MDTNLTGHIRDPTKESLPPAAQHRLLNATPPSPNSEHYLQSVSLILISFPKCTKHCTLTEGSTHNKFDITCSNCGTLDEHNLTDIRKRQVNIIRTALSPSSDQVPENTGEMEPPPQQTAEAGEDTIMQTNDPDTEKKNQKHTQYSSLDVEKDGVTKHNETKICEDEPGGATAEEVLDVAWFAGSITKLDRKWAERWNKLEQAVSQMVKKQTEGFAEVERTHETKTNLQAGGLRELNKKAQEEVTRAETRAVHVNQRLESLAQNHREIRENQDEQKKSLADLRANIIQDIQQKLEAVTGASRQEQTTAGNSPETKAAWRRHVWNVQRERAERSITGIMKSRSTSTWRRESQPSAHQRHRRAAC